MSTDDLSKEDLLRYLERRAQSGNWSIYFWSYLEVMTHDEALLVQFFVDRIKFRRRADGWTTIPVKQTQMKTKFSKDQQHRAIQKLVKRGYVQVTKKGIPPKRLVKVDLLKIEHDIDRATGTSDIDRETATYVHRKTAPYSSSSIRSIEDSELKRSPTRRNRRGRASDTVQTSPPGGNTPMPFDGFKIPPETKIKEHHLVWAERLRKACVQNGWKHQWSKKKWADQFRVLEGQLSRKELGKLVPEDIEPVLTWFEKVAPDKKIEVQHAEHFRKSFVHLHRWANKGQAVMVQVSDKAKTIADKFRGKFSNYRWPKGSADCLDAFVQVTLASATDFRDKLKTVAKSDDKRRKDNMAAVLLKTKFMYFDHPDTFTEKWVQAVYDDIKDWDGWSGNLVSMAFAGDLGQKRMDRIGKQWATDYFGSDKPWTELKESLR